MVSPPPCARGRPWVGGGGSCPADTCRAGHPGAYRRSGSTCPSDRPGRRATAPTCRGGCVPCRSTRLPGRRSGPAAIGRMGDRRFDPDLMGSEYRAGSRCRRWWPPRSLLVVVVARNRVSPSPSSYLRCEKGVVTVRTVSRPFGSRRFEVCRRTRVCCRKTTVARPSDR